MRIDAATLERALGSPLGGGHLPADFRVGQVASDSRRIGPGALFACIPGARADGHDFAAGACRAGAAALLVQRPLGDVSSEFPHVPQFVVPDAVAALGRLAAEVRSGFGGLVVGVTGTAGKTTLKEWIASSLLVHARSAGLAGGVARTAGNFNNQLGLPLSVLAASGREDFWVFEAGVSHPGDMEELAGILRPDVGVVLNAGVGHAEGLGVRGTAWHKTRMFASLSARGRAVASADYPDLAREALAVRPDVLFFSAAAPGDPAPSVPAGSVAARASIAGPDARTAEVSLRLSGAEARLSLPMPFPGRACAENLACLCLVLALCGVPADDLGRAAGEGAAGAVLPGHRFLRERVGASLLVDDSYNANPLSMGRMLEAASAEARALGLPLGLVLGEMGELGAESERAHAELGRLAAALRPAFLIWKGGMADAVRSGAGEGIPFDACAGDAELEAALAARITPAAARAGLAVLCKGSRSNGLERAALAARRLLAQEDR